MDLIFDLKNFWSSLITEKGIAPHVNSLMKIADSEERSLALMSRVSFLWCMGLKFEREDLQNKLFQIQDIINKPDNCITSCNKCLDIKSLLAKQNQVYEGYRNVSCKNTKDLCNVNTCTPKRKCQEHSPQQVKKLRKGNKENEDCSPVKPSFVDILAPETQLFTQIINEKQVLVIPETIPVDEIHYGNTDFFQDSQICEFGSPPVPKIQRSPVLGKLKINVTPIQNKSKATLCFVESPVCDKTNLSPEKTLVDDTALLKSPDSLNCSPLLLGCNRNMSLQSSPKKNILNSPLKEKRNNSPPLIKAESFSGKPPSSPLNIDRSPLSSRPSTLGNTASRQTRQLLLKSRSEVGNTISNRSKLSRIKTLTSLKNSRPNIEVSFDSPVQKKNFRQTKITQNSFKPKDTNVAKLTGGKCAPVKVSYKEEDNEDEAIAKAIEESIHTKEIEDILRKKHQQLDKQSPGKMKILTSERNKKERVDELELRKSPRKKNEKSLSSNNGPSGKSSQVTVEEVLADLEGISEKQKKEEKPNRLRRNRTKIVLQDSFDLLPAKDSEPTYAYKGNVARKNHDKKKLEGWDCHECRDYYEAKGISNEERKEQQNKCSRHRSKHKPVTNTPEGFWVLGWSDEET